MPSITSIFVTYNSESKIGQALSSMRDSHESGLVDCIVVDNASKDGTVALIQREHPWVQVIASPENLGYGKGLNLGLSHATTPYILFINPDAVMSAGAVRALWEFMESHPKAGMAAPAIIEGPDNYQHAGGIPTPWDIVARAAGFKADRARHRTITPGSEPFSTDWICGAILLARRQLMNELGGFDPRFFLYHEETDLCLRVLQHGHELWAVGKSVANHAQGASARATNSRLYQGCIAEHYFRSRFYYFMKHHGLAAAVTMEAGEISAMTLSSILNLARGQLPRQLIARLKAPIFKLPAPVTSQRRQGGNAFDLSRCVPAGRS